MFKFSNIESDIQGPLFPSGVVFTYQHDFSAFPNAIDVKGMKCLALICPVTAESAPPQSSLGVRVAPLAEALKAAGCCAEAWIHSPTPGLGHRGPRQVGSPFLPSEQRCLATSLCVCDADLAAASSYEASTRLIWRLYFRCGAVSNTFQRVLEGQLEGHGPESQADPAPDGDEQVGQIRQDLNLHN